MIKNSRSEGIYIVNPAIDSSPTDCSNFMISPTFSIFISICSVNYLMATLHDLTKKRISAIYKRHIETNVDKE